MKAALVLLLTGLLAGCATPPAPERIASTNYGLRDTLRANWTYTGVVLDQKPVIVRAFNDSLLVGLPATIGDVLLGTDNATMKVPATQFTVRVDGTRYERDQLVTIIQGRNVNVPNGAHVFIVTSCDRYDANNYTVRLSEYRSTSTYAQEGMREGWEKSDAGRTPHDQSNLGTR